MTAGFYPDGRVAELFIRGDKIGEMLGGVLDTVAMAISMGLQHGVPLETFINKLRHQRFEPSGKTGDSEFRECSSMFDLIAQWLEKRFPNGKAAEVV